MFKAKQIDKRTAIGKQVTEIYCHCFNCLEGRPHEGPPPPEYKNFKNFYFSACWSSLPSGHRLMDRDMMEINDQSRTSIYVRGHNCSEQ